MTHPADHNNLSAWTVSRVLLDQAKSLGNRTMLQVGDNRLGYQEALNHARGYAGFLSEQQVKPGDYVAVMLPNSLEFCTAWFGLSWLGAVLVAVNTDYRGRFLRHVFANCRCSTLIVHADFLGAVMEIADQVPDLKNLIVVGNTINDTGTLKSVDFNQWQQATPMLTGGESTYRDVACVMYTSGTTGPSKGVLMPNAHLYLFGKGTIEHMDICSDDVFYIVLPLFHANGLFMQLFASMIAGATAVIRQKFSASAWIDDVVHYGVTVTNSLGVVAAFVLNQPPGPNDRAHSLRCIGMAPNSEALETGFRERFGVSQVIGMYGMTEVNIPLYMPWGQSNPDSCGMIWKDYFELKIVNPETDQERNAGEVGEIVVRPGIPFGFMSGYLNMPDKTVEAWRNFWFHTGDAAWIDQQGYVYFVDRIKDCIRRRGENISSYEIEQSLLGHKDVVEAAAFAVPSDIPGTEDEVMVAIVTDAGISADFKGIAEYATQIMPGFSVPRFIRQVDQLPKTPTGKVQKHLLRHQGITPETWDRTQ